VEQAQVISKGSLVVLSSCPHSDNGAEMCDISRRSESAIRPEAVC